MGCHSISHGKSFNYPWEITRFPMEDFSINKLFEKINLLFIRKRQVICKKRPDVCSKRYRPFQSKLRCFEVKATFTLHSR